MLSCSKSSLSRRPRLYTSRFQPMLAALGLSALGLAACHPALAQTAVLTQNNDNARSGSNTTETVLTPANVNQTHFGKLFEISGLNANVNGQVLFQPGVVIGGVSHNVVFAYTSNNTDNSPCGLYAYDADNGQQLWQNVLTNSATYTTATPVIDPSTSTIYVLTKSNTDDTGLTYLHAFDITTGQDKYGSPIQVTASAPGTGDGSTTVNGTPTVFFDGDHGNGRFHANDRAGLLLVNGVVYASFAHNSDSNPYHGWVLGYQYAAGSGFTQKYVFCTTPNGSSSNTPGGGDGGVWQAGKGLTADAGGNIYFSVGNGTFDANNGGIDYGMCYMKLSPSLQVLDWFAPNDEKKWSDQDLDLGNSGLTLIPGTTSLFAGGTKFGSAFLLDTASLGKFTGGGPDKVVNRIDNVSSTDDVGQNSIGWDGGSFQYAYLWPGGQPIEQFRFNPSAGKLTPGSIFVTGDSSATNGGSLAVSSNGTSNAILWAVDGGGVLRAYDATNVANGEFWDSSQNSSRDSFSNVGHFQFPTVVDGKVYVPTGNATVEVYGLLPSTATVSQVRFAPRAGYEKRMIGGAFQGSNDGATYTTLATVTQAPADTLTTLPIANPAAYRFLRYLAPSGSYGNISELEFDSSNGKITGTPYGTAGSYNNSGNDITKAFDGSTGTFFDAPSSGSGNTVGLFQEGLTQVSDIDAGGGQAGIFQADGGFTGSSRTSTTTAAISTAGVTNPAPQAVYQSERYGSFTYTLSNQAPGASYTLRLHFAEFFWNAAGKRVFNVSVNGTPVLSNFDIFAAAGGEDKAVVKDFPVSADSSGKVTVVFTSVKDYAKISGLELLK